MGFTATDDMIVGAPSVTKSEGRKMSSDEQDHHAATVYKEAFDIALQRWWKEADEISKAEYAAYKQEINDHRLGEFGNKVLDIPIGLAYYLANEYAGGDLSIFSDKDFVMYLQKAVGQSYLASM
jgi:hypothetical protein